MLAIEFMRVKSQLKKLNALKKREKALKEHFESLMDKDKSIIAGDILIVASNRKNSYPDRDKIKKDLGVEDLKDYEKEAHYLEFELKNIGEKK